MLDILGKNIDPVQMEQIKSQVETLNLSPKEKKDLMKKIARLLKNEKKGLLRLKMRVKSLILSRILVFKLQKKIRLLCLILKFWIKIQIQNKKKQKLIQFKRLLLERSSIFLLFLWKCRLKNLFLEYLKTSNAFDMRFRIRKNLAKSLKNSLLQGVIKSLFFPLSQIQQS